MIVSAENIDSIIDKLMLKNELALDTETTGLRKFHGDRLFSIIIHDGNQGYYFNFNDQNENDRLNGETILSRDLLPKFERLFSQKHILWILANAKYDMHILANDGLSLAGDVWDVLVMARVERNDHIRYGLEYVAERVGYKKSNAVDEYIKKYRCYKKVRIPGKKGEKKNPQFWMVPLPIISEYGIQDAFITMMVYRHQRKWIETWEAKEPIVSIWKVIRNEIALTKVCFTMERRGVLLDSHYVTSALVYEQNRADQAKEAFKQATGCELVDSYISLKKAFEPLGISGGKTAKGAASFTDEILSPIDHPAAKALLEFRDANKRASSYYSSFLYFADSTGIVHCDIRQSATKTGRFSITDPALQTLNSEEADDEGVYETEWRVRRAFKPRPGYCIVAIDFKAFEFRSMLDTAGEKDLADAISNGLDPHKATADLVGITRKFAKTINFGLLYGMGAGKLAASLGVSIEEARRLKSVYFEKLPKIRQLINDATYTAERKQRVINRFGRPYMFPDPKWAYKALNALIQGGTAEAIKFAMVEIDQMFRDNNLKSGILLQVHDELLFEIHESELWIIPKLKEIMERSWPEKFHKMECSVEHSWKSWGELEEGYPNGAEERDAV